MIPPCFPRAFMLNVLPSDDHRGVPRQRGCRRAAKDATGFDLGGWHRQCDGHLNKDNGPPAVCPGRPPRGAVLYARRHPLVTVEALFRPRNRCRLCRPLGYADLAADRPAGQGFRAGQVGKPRGLADASFTDCRRRRSGCPSRRAGSSPFGWWDRSRGMRGSSRRCWPSVVTRRCPGSASCR